MFSAKAGEVSIDSTSSYEEAQSSLNKDPTSSPATSAPTFASLSFGGDAASSAASYTRDTHAVSEMESKSYYEGLHSRPTLLYRTGKKWSPPRGPEAFRHLKELRPAYTHPIVKLWNIDLSGKVVEVLDAHIVSESGYIVS